MDSPNVEVGVIRRFRYRLPIVTGSHKSLLLLVIACPHAR
jgi:hypothetical protein